MFPELPVTFSHLKASSGISAGDMAIFPIKH